MTTYLPENAAELWLTTPGFFDLLLTGTNVDDDGNKFRLLAQANDSTWDAPVPIEVAVQRWMTDGAVTTTQGHENRNPAFKLVVSADTAAELAAGEAALALRATSPGLQSLTWIPPSGVGAAPSTVFEIWTWHLGHALDLDAELRLSRMYQVNMTAKPWVRSAALTTVTANAVSATPTVTSVDTCAATTNWTGSPNAVTSTGGSVRESATVTKTGVLVGRTLTRTATVSSLGSTPYLTLDTAVLGGVLIGLVVTIDNIELVKVAQLGSVSYWKFPAGTTTFTTLKVVGLINPTIVGAVELSIAQVSVSDTVGAVSSGMQLARTLVAGGSVPTSGSIQIASPSATKLGNVLLYTSPDIYSGHTPPMRQYRTSGNTVGGDATCVSGAKEQFVAAGGSVGTGVTYTLGAGLLREATYVLAGRFIFSVASTLTVTVTVNTTGYPTTVYTGLGQVTMPLGTAVPWWGVIGTLTLPPQALPATSTLSTVIKVSGTASASATVDLDELWLLDVTHGALTLVQDFTTTPDFTKMWVDAPDADTLRNRPAVYIGTAADRSDAVTPRYDQPLSIGDHDLNPRGSLVFTACDGVANAAVTGSLYHRWHTHAGD